MLRDDGGPGLWGTAARAGREEHTDEPGLLVVALGNVIMIAAFSLAYGLIVLGVQVSYRALFLKIHDRPVYEFLAGVLGFLILAVVIYVATTRKSASSVAGPSWNGLSWAVGAPRPECPVLFRSGAPEGISNL